MTVGGIEPDLNLSLSVSLKQIENYPLVGLRGIRVGFFYSADVCSASIRRAFAVDSCIEKFCSLSLLESGHYLITLDLRAIKTGFRLSSFNFDKSSSNCF